MPPNLQTQVMSYGRELFKLLLELEEKCSLIQSQKDSIHILYIVKMNRDNILSNNLTLKELFQFYPILVYITTND